MARASTPTILSLERYARIIGLDPIHFSGGYSTLRPSRTCGEPWLQYDWQNNRVSRQQIADKIQQAEADIAEVIGYWPAPVWIAGEWQVYPRPHRRELYGTGLTRRGDHKRMNLNWGYVLYGGMSAAVEIEAGEVTQNVDVDADGDGFAELASWTITNADIISNPCELRAYFKEYLLADAANTRTDPNSEGADPEWEIRPVSADVDGLAVEVLIPKWCLFRPQLQEALDATGIDADVAGNFVDDVVFYRVYNNYTEQVQFLWGESCAHAYPGAIYPGGSLYPGTTAVACAYELQSGCFDVRDARNSLISPQPGSYDSDTDSFAGAAWTGCVEPDAVRFWYKAGFTSPRGVRGCDQLDNNWAKMIAMLATARLDMPVCTCSAVEAKVDDWREDLSRVGDEVSHQVAAVVLNNPFGTRRGEVEVWKQITRISGRARGRAVVT